MVKAGDVDITVEEDAVRIPVYLVPFERQNCH